MIDHLRSSSGLVSVSSVVAGRPWSAFLLWLLSLLTEASDPFVSEAPSFLYLTLRFWCFPGTHVHIREFRVLESNCSSVISGFQILEVPPSSSQENSLSRLLLYGFGCFLRRSDAPGRVPPAQESGLLRNTWPVSVHGVHEHTRLSPVTPRAAAVPARIAHVMRAPGAALGPHREPRFRELRGSFTSW